MRARRRTPARAPRASPMRRSRGRGDLSSLGATKLRESLAGPAARPAAEGRPEGEEITGRWRSAAGGDESFESPHGSRKRREHGDGSPVFGHFENLSRFHSIKIDAQVLPKFTDAHPAWIRRRAHV